MDEPEDEVEVVDAVPVVAVRREVAVKPPGQVAVQAAAVAATSFAVGAVGAAMVRRGAARRSLARRRRRDLRGRDIVATRSFLVDVHVLGGKR